MTLTTHSIPLFPLRAIVACSRASFTFFYHLCLAGGRPVGAGGPIGKHGVFVLLRLLVRYLWCSCVRLLLENLTGRKLADYLFFECVFP